MKLIPALVRLHAAGLLLVGGVLLFAPEAAVEDGDGAGRPPALAQVLGAALIGFAAAGWTVRDAPLGGIYGRAVVTSNQVFAVTGVLVLLKGLPPEPRPAFWALLGVLAVGAVLYGVLLYRSPRPGPPPA